MISKYEKISNLFDRVVDSYEKELAVAHFRVFWFMIGNTFISIILLFCALFFNNDYTILASAYSASIIAVYYFENTKIYWIIFEMWENCIYNTTLSKINKG